MVRTLEGSRVDPPQGRLDIGHDLVDLGVGQAWDAAVSRDHGAQTRGEPVERGVDEARENLRVIGPEQDVAGVAIHREAGGGR